MTPSDVQPLPLPAAPEAAHTHGSILERVSDAFLALDTGWRIVFLNERAAQALGRRREDLLGRDLWAEMPEGIGGVFHQAYHRAMAEQTPLHIEEHARTRGRWFENHIYPSPDGLSIFFRDVTERRETQRQLAESEQRYRSLFELNPDAVFSLDPEGRFVAVNPACERLSGYPPEDLLGRPFSEIVAPESQARAWHSFAGALAGAPEDEEIEIRHKSGRGVLLYVTKVPIRVDGGITGVYGIAKDITERRETQRRLAESEQKYRSLADQNPDAVFTFDRDGCFLAINPACERISGYTMDELWRIPFLQMIAPEDQARAQAAFEGALTGRPQDEEFAFLHKSGRRLTLHVTKMPILVDAEVTGVFGVAKDITRRRQAEEALRESEERMRAIAETTPVAMTITRWEDSALLYANRHFREMFALPLDADLSGRGSVSLYADPADRLALLATLTEREHIQNYEIHCQRQDGSPVWVTGSFQRTIYNGEKAVFSAYHDFTERRRMEEALRESEERMRMIAETSPVAMTITRWEDGTVLFANRHFESLFGIEGQTVGRDSGDFYADREDRDGLVRALAGGALVQNYEVRCRRSDGTAFWTSGSFQRTTYHGQPAIFAAYHDVTERRWLLEQARAEAERDPLTGLLNHRAFHKSYEEEARAAQSGESSLAVVMLDLDNFKFFNDAYGHAVGDEVLRLVADALRGACRTGDTLARFGGDEFALLLPDVGAEVTADEISARLLSDLREVSCRPPGGASAIPVSLSVGVALFPADAPHRSAVMALADERLLRAKTGGLSGGEARQVRAAMQGVGGFAMLDALVNAVDNKDRYTRRHSEDVLVHSLRISRALGLDEKTRQTVEVAALLHDVGKIGIPDAILRKPGALTPEEFEAVRQHPVMGAVIVGAVPGLEETLEAVRHHHERWDGGGYPDGLAGEASPLLARLLAVADAYSAMTSDRPYRKGKSAAQALAALESGAGSQWCPACVAAFLGAVADSAGHVPSSPV